MKTTSSVVVLAALSTGALGRVQPYNVTYVPASSIPYGAHSPSSTRLIYETTSATPLPSSSLLESEPCESETSTPASMPTQESTVRTTTTLFVTIPVTARRSSEATTGHASSTMQSWSPSNSYVAASPLASSSVQASLPSSIHVVAPSSAPTPQAASTPASGYPVVPQAASSSSGAWSLSNSFYVIPAIPASSGVQSSPLVVIPVTVSTVSPQSYTPLPVSGSSLAASFASMPAQALSVVQSASYIPGVIPLSTPGVVPSYTPGVVLPSYTPGIPASPASSATTIRSSFVTPSQLPTFVITPSASGSASTATRPSVTAPSSAPPAIPSAVSSIASQASAAASSITSAASSALSSLASALTSPAPSPSSAPVSATSSPRPSSARSSTLGTSTTATTSSSQGTSIPPAPSAGGASGMSAKGKERVWWVAFLAPLVMFV